MEASSTACIICSSRSTLSVFVLLVFPLQLSRLPSTLVGEGVQIILDCSRALRVGYIGSAEGHEDDF